MNNIQKNFKAKSALRKGHGGNVNGPGGPTDDKVGPVMLSDEEYVLPADTTAAIGVENLDALRDATHDFGDRRPLNGLRDGGQREAMRAITHAPDGSRRMGDNPERAAMMQESFDQPVTRGEPVQHTPLPLPAQPHALDTNPANAFMYENPLGDMVDNLREHLPGLRDGGSRRQYSAGVAPAFDREKYVAMGKAMQQDRAPRRQYSTGTKPDFEIPQAEPRGLRRQYGSMQRMADGGRVLSPEELLRQRTVGVAAPSAPPTVVPPTSPIATAPGGNTLPATQNSSAPMRVGTAPRVERDMGKAQVVGDGKSRITGPAATAVDAAKPKSWLRANSGKLLGAAAGVGLSAKNMYDVSQDPESDWKDVLNQGGHELAGIGGAAVGSRLGATVPGPAGLATATAGGVAGYMGGQELANQADSLLGGDGMSPLAAIEKRKEAAANPPIGVMAPKDPNALSDFAGRITKGALSRPGGSALRSQGDPVLAPTPSGVAPNTVPSTSVAPNEGYQTEQLTKLGVSPEAQNGPSLPQGSSTLQSYGTKDYQNLGTYGGDANLYGRAGDASKPGRMNDFVGVGATATPQSALRGNTLSSNDAQVQRGRELLAQDKARTAGGRDPNKLYIGTADGELGSMEQRFGAARRQVMQDFGGAGQQAQRNRALQNIAQQEAAAINERDTTQTTAETARMGQDALERTSRYKTDADLEASKYTTDATAVSALRTAQTAAAKDARTVRNTNEKNLTAAIDDTVKVLSEGDATKAAQLTNMLTTLPPKMKEKLQDMAPVDQRAIMQALASVHGAGMNMDAERDTGGMLQNATLGGLVTGAGSVLSHKKGNGKALGTVGGYVDKALQFVPKLNKVVPKHGFETLGNFAGNLAPVAGVAGGAYFTPKNQPTNRPSPLQYNADGTPTVQDFNWTDALNNGIFDTLWDTNFRRVDGQLVNKAGLTPDQVDAYRMISEAN